MSHRDVLQQAVVLLRSAASTATPTIQQSCWNTANEIDAILWATPLSAAECEKILESHWKSEGCPFGDALRAVAGWPKPTAPLAISAEDRETIDNVLIHEAYALKEDSESEAFYGLETKEDLAKTAEHLGAVAARFRAAPIVDVEAVMEVAEWHDGQACFSNPIDHRMQAAKLRKAVGRE